MSEISCIYTGALGVNTYIVQLEGKYVFIVDPAGCRQTGDERAVVDWLASRKKIPAGIFLTHGHFDHITGIGPILSAFPDCPVAVHSLELGAFDKTGGLSAYEMVKMFGAAGLLSAVENLPRPNALCSGGETLDKLFCAGASLMNDGDLARALSGWSVIHTPGHSPGSCCLYSERERVLISGDTLFYRSWGRTDLAGGNERQLAQSLAMLRKTIPPQTKVYPGHDTYGFAIAEG